MAKTSNAVKILKKRMTEKRKAYELGKATVKLMRTKGWKVHIWKNPHWYVYIHKGMMTIRPQVDLYGNVTYSVTLSEYHLGASSVEYSTNRSFKNPNKAVDYALSLATKHKERIESIIKTIRSDLKCPSEWVA